MRLVERLDRQVNRDAVEQTGVSITDAGVDMGFNDFMEKRAQKQLLMRAMDASWVAATCSGMVFGPLALMLESAVQTGKAQRQDVDDFIDNWLESWQQVRHLSDRNLTRNRHYYEVRPNEMLSPILSDFQMELESIRASSKIGPSEAVERLKCEMYDNVKKLQGFNEWAESAGRLIDFDTKKYEPKAVKRAQNYWEPTVRAFKNS